MCLCRGRRLAGVAVDDLLVYPALPRALDDCLDPGADGRGPGPEHAVRHEGIEIGEQGVGNADWDLPRLHPKKYTTFGTPMRISVLGTGIIRG